MSFLMESAETTPESSGRSLDMGTILRSMADFGLASFPRKVGTPGQTIVYGPDQFAAWWRRNHDRTSRSDDPSTTVPVPKVPMFIGHNGVVPTKWTDPGALKHDVKEFVFEAAFGDFDASQLAPSEVWDEVQRTEGWLRENRLTHAWKASGSEGGFHVKVFFKREVHPQGYLARWEQAFWRGLKNELSVRSIDPQCFDPPRLERIPYSRYVHKKDPAHPKEYVVEPNYCVPVPWQWVRDGEYDRIQELSFYPEVFDTVRFLGDFEAPSLEGFVRRKGWERFGHVMGALHPEPAYEVSGMASQVIQLHIPHKRCLQVLPFGSNPAHAVRFGLLCELMGLGMGYEWTASTIIDVGTEAKWEDLDPEKIRGFVRSAVQHNYRPESCDKLRDQGVCLGASCRLFRDQFPEEWRAHLEKHPEDAA